MKYSFCTSLLSPLPGFLPGFFLTSCQMENTPEPIFFSLHAVYLFLFLLCVGLLTRFYRDRRALRREQAHMNRLLSEQKKALNLYRHQAEWQRRADIALLIEKKNRLARCLLHQLDAVKQHKLAPGAPACFSEAEWKELLTLIDVAYDDFTLRLQAADPALTQDAVRFCCLLKAGFSVEEIMRLLSVTKDAVYKRRSRLRKELLPSADERSLEAFLTDF